LKPLGLCLFVILCVVHVVSAQGDCPTIVETALNHVNDTCFKLGRNQTCYGNIILHVTPRENAANFTFEQAGDIVDVASIDSLRLSSMNLVDDTWGVALMQLQANLPDTVPGQSVSVLLFGDVEIRNAVRSNVVSDELSATTLRAANFRSQPSTQASVLSSIPARSDLSADGRSEDGLWLHIQMPNLEESGWIFGELLAIDGDVNDLDVLNPDEVRYSPMQAFYLHTGANDAPCAEAPNSGILIQTPQGVGTVNFLVNEVNIHFGSTVYLQANAGLMTVSVVEGHAIVSADGVSQTVPAGTFVQIPLDNNEAANGAPTFPQPYDMNILQALPVNVALPRAVTIAPAIENEADIIVAIDIVLGLPTNGAWHLTSVDSVNTCSGAAGAVNDYHVIFTFSNDRQTLADDDTAESGPPFIFTRTGDNVYTGTNSFAGGQIVTTYVFTSATTMTFSGTAVFGDPAQGGCRVVAEGTGVYEG
jgi:hypothetical protein